MPNITISRDGATQTVQAPAGNTLLDAIQQAGIQISMPCGGQHRCGKCLVHAAGAVSPVTPSEAKMLEGQPNDVRLACFATIEGDCHIALPEAAEAVIETAYAAWQGNLEPIYDGGYGAAFDIGTTTVAGQLFSHGSKRPVAVQGQMNVQQPYGADVLTRVVHCNTNGVAPLRDMIRGQLSAMLQSLCGEAGIPPSEVQYMTVCGNTIMMYILAGYEPRPLGMVPFTMEYNFGQVYDFALPGFEGLPIYVPGCASAYIGADITCSILASDILDAPGNVLLIDAGTNGEMALRTDKGLTCCSTAAGPAFEGAGISCGGNAAAGAIDSVDYVSGAYQYTTIGAAPATKICGSGLIDAAAALLNAGVLNAKGAMEKDCGGKVFIGDSPVYLSQSDIRQLQLAKGAIRGGMDTLMHECGITYDELDKIVLCGGFGSYMRPESAQRIGLIPPGTAAKTIAIGNAAGNGAAQVLQSREKQAQAVAIASKMEVVELSTSPYFMERFLQTMAFDV